MPQPVMCLHFGFNSGGKPNKLHARETLDALLAKRVHNHMTLNELHPGTHSVVEIRSMDYRAQNGHLAPIEGVVDGLINRLGVLSHKSSMGRPTHPVGGYFR